MKFYEEKNKLIEMALKLYRDKLIVGTWGNLSCRVRENDKDIIIITPSGMDYENTKLNDLVCLSIDGSLIEGSRVPSSELLMHLNIYKNRNDINAVFHTHSTYATACSVSGLSIPMIVEDMVMHLKGEIKLSEYALPGTEELADNVVKALGESNGVILRNHGAVGTGKDMDYAYKSCVLIEKSALILSISKALGKVNVISQEDSKKMIKSYSTNYGQPT